MDETDRRISVRGEPGRCPYCRDLVVEPKETVACAACGARQHERCQREHGACASCGADALLVPRAQARRVRERPPAGSSIQVQRHDEGTTEYTWPGFEGAAFWIVGVVLPLSLLVTAPLVLWALYWRFSAPPARLVLRPDGLRLETVGLFGRHVRDVRREDVGAIRLERIHQAGLRLSVDVGVDRMALGSVWRHPVLKEPELEWLHQVLLAWKDD